MYCYSGKFNSGSLPLIYYLLTCSSSESKINADKDFLLLIQLSCYQTVELNVDKIIKLGITLWENEITIFIALRNDEVEYC